ncbi:hypothetical protein JYU34_022695 [Plutella xylostella]|uniref:Uncharacterized protein n=1 Tax=Plutella xylostella TaxID=51655 RepID=A0ABQ7PPJ6_PLUXY|nr:hypothetical protein JYU34_022695 [Plutella xylostella]
MFLEAPNSNQTLAAFSPVHLNSCLGHQHRPPPLANRTLHLEVPSRQMSFKNKKHQANLNVLAQANANSFFGQQPPAAAPSVFGSGAAGVGAGAGAGGAAGAYSAADELSAEELASFSAAEFTLGLVPERAPPRELCV